MKRSLFVLIALLALWSGIASAQVCTTVNVGSSSSTQVLAANDLGSNGRHMLCLTVATSAASAATASIFAYCNVGGTAVANKGIILQGAANGGATWPQSPAQMFCFPQSQIPAKSFPIVPNGAVNCIGSASTTNVTACDW